MTAGRQAGVWTGHLALLILLAAAMTGCQALNDLVPTQPTQPSPAPSQSPVSIPVVLPAPTPTPILGGPPAPTPAPDPGSTPTPAPAPPAASCHLPPSNNPNAGCSMSSPAFLDDVDSAITQLTKQHPEIFDFGNNICGNCYYVKDVNAYANGVIANLGAMGYCAKYDGEELGVKNTNSFNEQYDIHLSSGHIRRGAGSYRSTCWPAWF